MQSTQKDVVLSASQINEYLACKRKWAWRKIAGITIPPGEGAALGTNVHSVIEARLHDGYWSEPDVIVRAGIATDTEEAERLLAIAKSGEEHLPTHGTPLEVERYFKFYWPSPPPRDADGKIIDDGVARIAFCGYKDAEYPGAIIDHKTTGNINAPWVKTSEDLKTDTQALVYAYEAFIQDPSLDEVDLTWIYYQTKGARKSKRVHLRMHRDHAFEQFEHVARKGFEIRDLLQAGTQPLELEPSPDECSKYGGCPYQSHCNLSPAERRGEVEERTVSNEATQAFLAEMRSKVAINPPEGDVPSPSAPDILDATPSLRDTFAMQAMCGLLANSAGYSIDVVAKEMWAMADAALAARGGR